MAVGEPARRVFLSHTSELSVFPKPRSFVAAAKDAVAAAGDAVVDMSAFTARDATPEQLDREMLAEADIYVLIAGFRYGTPVRGRPEVSYCEQEFEFATAAGMERLVFVLAEDTEGPPALIRDLEHGAKQEAFRKRLPDSGLTITKVSSPAELATKLERALNRVPRSRQESKLAGRISNIPARTATFTGRDDLLAGLRTALCSGRPAVVQALNGMGGVGKTTTAIEYAHRYAEDYDVAWWIPAEDPALATSHLVDLARALDLATEKDSPAVVLARLRGALQSRGRWLVVFDNAEDPAALRPLLPAGDGHVIITSRNPDWDDIGAALPVREFSRPESVRLLRTRCPRLTAPDADRIADALGDLPLAVNQAARLLATSNLTAEDYLELLAERGHELMGRHEKRSSYPVSLAAAWTVSFDQLARENPAALNILTLVAWLAPEPVPLTLLTHQQGEAGAVARDALAFADVTAALRSRGMAEVTTTTIQLHRVPAALLRARTQDDVVTGEDRDSTWPVTAVRLLHAGLPDNPWANPPSWPRWRELLPHLLFVCDPNRAWQPAAEEVAYLLGYTASYLQTRGEPGAALPLFQRAYALYRDRLGEDHPHTLTAANNLAVDLGSLGEHQQARELNEDTLTRRRRVLGEDDPGTLNSANNLAVDLSTLGEHQQARELNEDTLTRRRRVLGEDDPGTLNSANNLAVDLSNLGEHQQARELNEDTLTRRRRVLGEDDPRTLIAAGRLAVDLRDLGELQQARELHEDTLARTKRVVGDDHPDTIIAAGNLAADLRALGEHQRARELDEGTLARAKRVLGEDHPNTIIAASNLAADLRALGEHQRARELHEDVLARRKRVLGDED
ncbi:FxSxx-COOH system tetratricopeptide repeat protein [Amycolatopsis sp. FBCC-B4732]|uniref:FxSxx-COOH system tetratricopeptide repeat protein n=1 Tax=Amycolatopsis sp. FBCC-B4732 TaxID=3079339 RepID=UPI001FF6ED56|nr:FxSxx-COOH system tetratricopeptide repeat protein [Amycolatopsis sp. FBCC-B4732]UOX91469.1 FxSxx-COOH system tetratricopeptide repeat protein [Amycolatopsis sp. FBCC-B4732]